MSVPGGRQISKKSGADLVQTGKMKRPVPKFAGDPYREKLFDLYEGKVAIVSVF